jgi:benzoate/toluate 1,2-dioxygenase beta subunit
MAKPALKIAETPSLPVADVSEETQRAVERFLYRQAEILDDKRWNEWLDLFTEDGRYWAPVTADQVENDGVPNIFWEDLNLMRVRIGRNNHPNAWSQNPANKLSHVVSNVIIEREDPNTGDIEVRSKFFCGEYLRYDVRYFTGKYKHHLVKTPNGYKIKLQRVDLLNSEGPFDYVIQWWL